jgi:hypothetical protein
MVQYCKCDGCRYPEYHLSEYHQCGNCHKFGHGKRECGKNKAISKLYNNIGDVSELPKEKQCSLANCNHKHSHSLGSHNTNFECSHDAANINNKQTYKSTLTDTQITWVKERLHPDCYEHTDNNTNLNNFVYDMTKGLLHIKKDHPDESIYSFCSAGHGNVMYGKLEKGHQLVKVNMISYTDHDEIKNFISGYRLVSIK